MPGKACQICGTEDCTEHCPLADNGKHEPDVKTGFYSTHTARAVVFDFKCKNCHLFGGLEVPFKAEDLKWD